VYNKNIRRKLLLFDYFLWQELKRENEPGTKPLPERFQARVKRSFGKESNAAPEKN